MLTFKSKKQIKDIFTSLLSQNANHSHIKDLRKQFLSFTEIDNELEEKQLDTLQESLAELEEKKDDLTYKIAFLRKNLVKQLRNEYENVNYCDKIERMNVRFDVQVVCDNKPNEISGEESSVNEGSVIDELECLLTKEKNVVKKKEDAYQIAKKYFGNLH